MSIKNRICNGRAITDRILSNESELSTLRKQVATLRAALESVPVVHTEKYFEMWHKETALPALEATK